MVQTFKSRGWNCADAEKRLAERRKTSHSNASTLEAVRASVRKLERETRQQVERHERLLAQAAEVDKKISETSLRLAEAKAKEIQLLAKEHADRSVMLAQRSS